MNPHYLFLSIILVSISFAAVAFVNNGSMNELYEMARVLAVAGACVGVVLFATRKYWRNARRVA